MTGAHTGQPPEAAMDVDLIRATVAATLRHTAGWVADAAEREGFYDAANGVERVEPQDWYCCPVCEEVDCDDHCPLAEVRSYTEARRPGVT